MTTAIQVKTLSAGAYKTYLWAILFIAGNLILPQLCHIAGMGGKIFLPVMFFTLVAAARYGIACGVVTALFSPLVNYALFGMPSESMLLVIMLKSMVIALAAGSIVSRHKKISLEALVAVVVSYQLAGFLFQGFLFQDFQVAWSELLISWPGMLIQILGGWIVIRALAKR